MIHALKTEPEFFDAVIHGDKTFEVRENDRDFRVGDYLALNELDDTRTEYTGRSVLLYVSYVLKDERFCKSGYAVIGFKMCAVYELMSNTKGHEGVIVLGGATRENS